MLVSKYLVLTATTGTAPCAHPWQWKEKKKKKVTRTRKAVPLAEVVRGAMKERECSRLTVLPFSIYYVPTSAWPIFSPPTPKLQTNALIAHLLPWGLLMISGWAFRCPSWRPKSSILPGSSSPWHCMPRSYSSTIPVLSNHLSVF